VSQLTQSPPASPGRPAAQYVSAEHVVAEMADHGTRRLQRLSVVQILVLAMLAGGFVTVGALFSVLLVEHPEFRAHLVSCVQLRRVAAAVVRLPGLPPSRVCVA
jgi:hypothetical protein